MKKQKQLPLPKIYPVTCHTDHVGPGSTFVAISGFAQDGAKFIELAKQLGATKIISNVENPRKILAELSSQALGNPASKLKIIGVTGTKGKTTTTYLIDYILQFAGHKTALLGTIKNKIGEYEEEAKRTTPSSDFLHVFFNECVNQKVEYVTMEVSSHSLSLDRVHGIQFDAVGFTNIAPEHLDFYLTMDPYFQAKAQIFSQVKKDGHIVINKDNEWGQKAIDLVSQNDALKKNLTAFSCHDEVKIFKNDLHGLELELKLNSQIIQIKTDKMFGEFNAYNIAMACLITLQLGIPTQTVQAAISSFEGVPGRLQMHRLKNGAMAFVDYAHNPSSFEQVLKTIKPLSKDLIVVFGCGGDRDKTKRPVMGRLVSEFANKIIVTNDNPRNEDDKAIAEEIIAGITQEFRKNLIIELDRRKAIAMAAELSTSNSVIALLGKGHEDYYLVKDQILHLDDFEEIKKL